MSRFYICRICGNIIGMINDAGIPINCCGEDMELLEPNTVEASNEKHIPVVQINGDEITVNVGSIEHPMLPEHFIEWIYLETEKGGQRKGFKPGEKPEAKFIVKDDKPVAVYAYCNIHGLWKSDL